MHAYIRKCTQQHFLLSQAVNSFNLNVDVGACI